MRPDALGRAALVALPAVMTAYFAINEGGFFPNTVAFALLVLVQILVLRTVLARDPVAGFSPTLAVATGALALLALWTLVSQEWSDAPARSLIDVNRVLLYMAIVVLFGSFARRPSDLRWMLRGVAVVLVAICGVGVVTRLLPEVWPIEYQVANSRLSYPLGYWNAMGIVAGLGMVFCLHLASEAREHAVVRALAAGAIPLLAVTEYFTFSRGGTLAAIIGVLLYVVLVRTRGVLAAVVAAAPAAAIAVVAAYGADLLATDDPTTAQAVEQGHDLTAVLVACIVGAALVRLALAVAGRRLGDRLPPPERTRPVARIVTAAATVLALVVAVALGAPGEVADSVDGFLNTAEVEDTGDVRDRFISPASSYRIDHWDVALDTFAADPLTGSGAGTYPISWARDRPVTFRVSDAHSLYLEILSELGIVGLLLLLVALGALLVGLVRGLRGRGSPNRTVYAALLAGAVAWVVHAGVDWDWEMPVTAVWLFALGGAACAARQGAPRRGAPREGEEGRSWTVFALGWAILAVAPVILVLSQSQLNRSGEAFAAGDCREATTQALRSIKTYGARSDPYQIVGYCDVAEGFPRLAVPAMEKAVRHDPESWEAHYGLALVQAQAGLDPRPQLDRAARLNPREVLVADGRKRIRAASRERWPQLGSELQAEFLNSGRLEFALEGVTPAEAEQPDRRPGG